MHIKLVLKGAITMDLEIEDRLQEIYKFIKIEVNFKDFRKYEITIKIEHQGYNKEERYFKYAIKGLINFDQYEKFIDNHIPRID